MNNAELRAAIDQTAARIHEICYRTAPEKIHREVHPHREHLKVLMEIEIKRALGPQPKEKLE